MAGPSNGNATESEALACLLDPASEIPFDVHFDIEDVDGTDLGTLGGHKNILALRSPVFKAMLFGSLKETGDHIKIKATSMFAFKTMLQYIHGVDEEWWPWSVDIREMIRITDLAERYNLPGLQKKILNHAHVVQFPKDRLVEVAQLAEEFHVYKELSETLLTACSNYLLAILETPDDFNNFVKSWSEKGGEQSMVAMRLLARLDQWSMAYVCATTELRSRLVCDIRKIAISIEPRFRLHEIKEELEFVHGHEDTEDNSGMKDDILQLINGISLDCRVFTHSLRMCQKLDAEKANLEGLPLTLDTVVEKEEDVLEFTHEMSVRLHLDVIRLSTFDGATLDNEDVVAKIWTEMLRSIPEVKSIILLWFTSNGHLFDDMGHHLLAEKLWSCEKSIKQLPGYAAAREAYT